MSTLEEIKNAVTSLPPEQQLELDSFIWSLRKLPVIYPATVPWKEVREEIIARECSAE